MNKIEYSNKDEQVGDKLHKIFSELLIILNVCGYDLMIKKYQEMVYPFDNLYLHSHKINSNGI